LKVTTQPLNNCEVLMTVEIDDQQKEKLYKKAARRLAREFKIPGFRPGKAPYNIIVNRFGIEAIQDETLEDLTTDIFRSALDEANLEPYRQASLDSIEWEPLVMKVKVPTEPVVDLGDYRSIRLDVPEVEVTDDEINEQLNHLLEHYTTFNPVERPAQPGDFLSVIVTERDAETGEVLLEDHATTMLLEPYDSDEPDFIAHLSGLSAGEEATFTHTFPDDFRMPDYAGKTIEYTIRVEEVKEKEEMELDDEFAALVGDYDSLDELKDEIRQKLEEQKRIESDREVGDRMLQMLLERAQTIRWPAALEEETLDDLVETRRYDLQQTGIDFQTYLKTQQMTEEDFREQLRPEAQQSLRRKLVLEEVARQESISVSPQEVSYFLSHMFPEEGTLDEMMAGEKGLILISQVHLYLRERKTLRRLAAIARGEVETETEETETEAGESGEEGDAEAGSDASPSDEDAEAPASETDPHTL